MSRMPYILFGLFTLMIMGFGSWNYILKEGLTDSSIADLSQQDPSESSIAKTDSPLPLEEQGSPIEKQDPSQFLPSSQKDTAKNQTYELRLMKADYNRSFIGMPPADIYITHRFPADIISRVENDDPSIPGDRYLVKTRYDGVKNLTIGNAEGTITVNYLAEGKPLSVPNSVVPVFYTVYDPSHDWYTILDVGGYIVDYP